MFDNSWRKSQVFSIDNTAAGVVSCGGPKKSPRTSSIVQIIFSFWSFEISEGIIIGFFVEGCQITVILFGSKLPNFIGSLKGLK